MDLPGDSSKANGTGLSGKDSDGDGLDDDSEARLGTNPYSVDSDGNGVLDAREKYTRSFKNSSAGVEATICGEGDIGKNLTIGKEDKPSPLVSSLGGVYKVAEVTPHVNISWAYVKIYYDPTELADLDNYSMFLFDSSKNSIEPVGEQGINREEHYFWGNLSHLSNPFILNPQLAYQEWLVNWEKPEHVFKTGDTICIKANVHNNGATPVSNAEVEFWELGGSSVLIDTVTTPQIPAISSCMFYTTWTFKPDVSMIYVNVDPSDLIVETDESNNDAGKNLYYYKDSDGDGLTDHEEINGMRLAFPNKPVYTNPNMWDTDGDGLSDGQEMGFIVRDEVNRQFYAQYQAQYGWIPYDGNHFMYLSNPLLSDSDFDGVNDVQEIAAGTNPLVPDTPVPWESEFMWGFLFGDLISDDPAHGNIPFFAGNIAAGLCPLWEWVNMGEGIVGFGSNGDIPMATVTAATGAISAFPIPLVIDELPEIGRKATRFATRYSEMVGEAAQLLVHMLGDYSIEPLKALYGNSVQVLGTRGLTDGYLKVLADYGAPQRVMDDLAASGVTISTVERTTDGSLARVVKNVPEKGDISAKVKFVEKGTQLQFIEKVSNDIVAREYQELINVKIYRDGLSPQEAASQVLSEKGTLDQYRLQNKLDLKSNAGWLGEGIAKQDLLQRDGITLLGAEQGFYKTHPNQNGFDHIYIDAQGNYVIVESKCLQDGGSVGKGVLPLDGNIREMDDNWINSRIGDMEDNNLISHDLADELRAAANSEPSRIRKEIFVTQNVQVTGKVVEDTLMETGLGINKANIVKLGVWEYG